MNPEPAATAVCPVAVVAGFGFCCAVNTIVGRVSRPVRPPGNVQQYLKYCLIQVAATIHGIGCQLRPDSGRAEG